MLINLEYINATLNIYSLHFNINTYLPLGMSIGKCSCFFNENSKPMYPVHVSMQTLYYTNYYCLSHAAAIVSIHSTISHYL